MFSCEFCEIFKNTFFAEHLGPKGNHRRCSVKKSVIKNFVNFTGKHCCTFYRKTLLNALIFLPENKTKETFNKSVLFLNANIAEDQYLTSILNCECKQAPIICLTAIVKMCNISCFIWKEVNVDEANLLEKSNYFLGKQSSSFFSNNLSIKRFVKNLLEQI